MGGRLGVAAGLPLPDAPAGAAWPNPTTGRSPRYLQIAKPDLAQSRRAGRDSRPGGLYRCEGSFRAVAFKIAVMPVG